MKRPFELVAEIQEKDAIIETMNEAHKILIAEKDRLITELCDALEDWCKGLDGVTVAASDKALIQRAREATR